MPLYNNVQKSIQETKEREEIEIFHERRDDSQEKRQK